MSRSSDLLRALPRLLLLACPRARRRSSGRSSEPPAAARTHVASSSRRYFPPHRRCCSFGNRGLSPASLPGRPRPSMGNQETEREQREGVGVSAVCVSLIGGSPRACERTQRMKTNGNGATDASVSTKPAQIWARNRLKRTLVHLDRCVGT